MLSFILLLSAVSSVIANPLFSRAESVVGTPISRVTQSQWALLNKTVEGRLAFGQPIAAPCFQDFEGQAFDIKPNAEQCAAIQKDWSLSTRQSSQFGGYATAQWSGCLKKSEQCILNFVDPSNLSAVPKTCHQGAVSTYYIDVAKASDVTAAYAFSTLTGVPLNVKNTGHDYQGKSSAPDSLGLWTHNLRKLTHTETYKPEGCSETYSAMTVGAGQQFGEIYKYADVNNFTVVGGSSSTVGMSGGWIAGAGHSALGPTLGLGVDNVLEFRVVTPTTGLVTASRCKNKDLFFALAGGGPNTVGVVLESTHKIYPRMPLQVAFIGILTPTVDSAKKMLELSVSRSLSLTQRGWGGYLAITPRIGQMSAIILVHPKLNNTEATKDVQPIMDWVATFPKEQVVANVVVGVNSFYEAFTQYLVGPTGEAAPIGQPSTSGSRLLTEELWAPEKVNGTVKAIQDYMMALNPPNEKDEVYGPLIQLCLTAPYKLPATGLTAEPKAWRNTVMHAFGGVAWSVDSTLEYKKGRLDALNKAVQILRDLKPNGQAYINEAFYDEPNYESTFWDKTNYDRLLALKAKYDPLKLLNCWKCIGWKGASDSKYSCYP